MENNIVTKKEAIAIREVDGQPTMSSLRIAEVTGKEHKHVIRDIKSIFAECEIGGSKLGLSYLSTQNKELVHYLLPEREFNLVVSGYSAKYRLQLIDELMSYRKAQPVAKPLTTIELLALSTKALEDSENKRLEVTKMLAQSEIIADATRYSNDTFSVDEFCKIISSKLQDVSLGRTSCYVIFRSIGIVEKTSTKPSQRGMQIYLDYRSHDYGFATRVHKDKADQLIRYMIRHLREKTELNEALGCPLGDI